MAFHSCSSRPSQLQFRKLPLQSCLFLLLVFLSLLTIAESSIKLQDNGKKYSSKTDPRGKQLWKGYDYFARLAHIPGSLCLNGQTNKTIVPASDGLPIALILKSGGGCSLEQNIQYVAKHIQPEGHVGFLIVDSQAADMENAVEKNPHHKNRQTGRRDDDPEFPFFILHVTFDAEFDLLDAVYHQDDTTRQLGGPRIVVDARSASSPYWIAISAIIAACSCSFCILLQSWLEVEPEPEEPPVQNTRQRLTRQQVRNLLPVYKYDGCQLYGDDPQISPPSLPADMDCCSICLDDFEAGDALRILRCNHIYHAKCVGKWLVERSAVCPLCKEDLFEEEIIEDEEEEEEPQQPSESEASVWRRIYQNLVSTADDDDDEEQDVASSEEQPQSHASWWSRIFRRQTPVSDTSDLAEPLLAGTGDVEAQGMDDAELQEAMDEILDATDEAPAANTAEAPVRALSQPVETEDTPEAEEELV